MKVLYLVDNNLSTVGGEQESTKILIGGVSKKGVETYLIQPGRKIEFPGIGQKYIVSAERLKRVVKNPVLFIYYIFSVFFFVRRVGPNVIHTQAQLSFFIISFLRILRLIPGRIYFVHTERGIYSKYSFVVRSFFLFFLRSLDCLVCTTETNKKMWESALCRRSYNVPVNVVYNTAGEGFQPADRSDPGGLIKVGFAGRFCDWKDWPLAEEIVHRIFQKHDQLKVTMAVGCLDSNALDSTRKMFERMKLLLGDRFQGKINLPLDEMSEFYSQVDYFILTSWPGAESFGRTVVEAMSAGCVVFVTEGGGPPEVVGDARFVYKCVDELISNILSISIDKNQKCSISSRNVTRANEVFSLSANIDRYIDLYEMVAT